MANNIYIFTNSYKPVLGGIQTVTSQLAETLIKRGEKVLVVTSIDRKALKLFERIEGVLVFRFHFGFVLTYFFLILLFIIKRPKTVFVHFPLDQASFVLKLRKHFQFKLVTCFHGHDVLRYNEGNSKYNGCYIGQYNLVHASDRVSACSKYLANIVEQVFECSGVVSVYNGVDLSRYNVVTKRPFKHPYIFAFGRLEVIKGFDMLIKAFADIKEYELLHLLIAGDGTQRENLTSLIQKLNLDNRVELLGRKDPKEIVSLSQNAEVIVIPSYRESFGIVALEAIAAKRTIVSTNSGGLPEIVDSKYGILVEPNIFSIRTGIKTALANRDKYIFTDTEDYLYKFTIDKMVDNYMSLI